MKDAMRLCLSCFLIIVPVEAGTPELSTGIGGVPAASGYIVTDVLFGQYRMVLRDLLGRRCGFEPSCSVYGQEAIALHGPVLGVMVALERWTRCNSSALKADYYERTGDGLLRLDPLDTGRGDVKWDSLLLPF